MTADRPKAREAESNHTETTLRRMCGYCDDPTGLLALVGEHRLYCSAGCLIFADDYPPTEAGKLTHGAADGEADNSGDERR